MSAACPILPGFGDDKDGIAPIPPIFVQAFCVRADTATALWSAAMDRRLRKAVTTIKMGGVTAAISAYRNARTPNLILVEADVSGEEFLRQLDELALVCDPVSRVVVVGHLNDVFFYRELKRRGVSEYLVAPVTPLGIVQTVSALVNGSDQPLGRTIAVLGSKGGVGASTLAHNLAWAAAHDLAIETVIGDLDLAFGTASLDYNLDPTHHIADAVSAPELIDTDFIDRLLSRCADRLRLLAAPVLVDRAYDYATESFDPLLDALRASARMIVLDLPHNWAGWSKRILLDADGILIVAAPDLASLRNTKNLIDMLEEARPNDPRPAFCLNQVGAPHRPEIKPEDFATALQQEPVAAIPYEPQLFGAASLRGKMIAEIAPSHDVCRMFGQLARKLSGAAGG